MPYPFTVEIPDAETAFATLDALDMWIDNMHDDIASDDPANAEERTAYVRRIEALRDTIRALCT